MEDSAIVEKRVGERETMVGNEYSWHLWNFHYPNITERDVIASEWGWMGDGRWGMGDRGCWACM